VDGVIYVGTIDGTLYAVDLESQAVLWSFDDDDNMASIWGSPVVIADNLFIGDADGNVYAVSIQDGNPLWPTPFAAGSSVISSGVAVEDAAVFAASSGKIFTINVEKEPRTLTTVDATLQSALKYEDEKIILAPASSDGLFMAIDSSGNETWNYLPND
jgi:outer membrane protein assembly factor BamB